LPDTYSPLGEKRSGGNMLKGKIHPSDFVPQTSLFIEGELENKIVKLIVRNRKKIRRI
jgi:hypothetical protein